MVRDPGAPPARQAEGALELGAAGQHVAAGRQRQREHARDGAARAPQRQRPAAGHAQHRVVDARLDRAVVEHDEVGDRRQPLARVVVLVGDRLVGDVAARHHQRLAHVGQQQVMERAVGQHHAELGRARRHRPGHARVVAAAGEHDRPVAPQPAAPSRPARARPARGRRRGPAPSARTASPRGACARAAARPPRSSPARQARWNPPIPLTATMPPSRSSAAIVVERVREARPALGAGVGLGVEAAVRRVGVLGRAGLAHREGRPSWSAAGRTGRRGRS